MPDNHFLCDSGLYCPYKIPAACQHCGVVFSPVRPGPKPPNQFTQKRYHANNIKQKDGNLAASYFLFVLFIDKISHLPARDRAIEHSRPQPRAVEQLQVIMCNIRQRISICTLDGFELIEHLFHVGEIFAVCLDEPLKLLYTTTVELHEGAADKPL